MPATPDIVEKALQRAAHEADVVKAKEEGGQNRGKHVRKYLASCGLPEGNPWCAAFVTWCLQYVGWSTFPPHSAAVRYWRSWAKDTDRLFSDPSKVRRGDLFLWVGDNGNGHIGWVCEASKFLGMWSIRTIEGNSNEAGSREGDRVVRKWRPVTKKFQFIRLAKPL